MSRLYDRVLQHGCAPLTGAHLFETSFPPDQRRALMANALRAESGSEPSPREVDERIAEQLEGGRQALSDDFYTPDELADAVVISAEEVADYCATLPEGTDALDILDVVAPPFNRMFIEVQNRPSMLSGVRSWGILIGALELPRETADTTNQGLVGEEQAIGGSDARWVVGASLVAEWQKGTPVGPVARWLVNVDATGHVVRGGFFEGMPTLFAFPLAVKGYDEAVTYSFTNVLGPAFLAPALFAISLMHCKNVDVRAVDPPERLSRKHERRHGRPLTRYHVLEIEPMRRILDYEGEAQTRGLRHALHICRGHFKTYTDAGPLLGKHVGTYWWPAHARGTAAEGVVEKDYRIRLDQGLGREYIEADEQPEISPNAPEHVGLDPDLGGRGLKAHNVTQNLLAVTVGEAGYEPRRPRPDEPQYDLAWEVGDVTWVAEVKSVTAQNEERQLRYALGQVMRYRQLLAADGRTVKAAIATEREPSDPTWAGLLSDEDVLLVWPGHTEELFSRSTPT